MTWKRRFGAVSVFRRVPVLMALTLLGSLLGVLVLTGVLIWQAKRSASRMAGGRR